MRTPKHPSKIQPLSFSLARLGSAAAVCAALFAAKPVAESAVVIWDGTAVPTPGDGILWTDVLNWNSGALPASFDDVRFGNVLAVPGRIQLNGSQTVNSLEFTASNYVLGSYGDRNQLTVASGNIVVNSGVSAVINSDYAGTSALNLSGGGKLLLNSFVNSFTGGVTVDGAGTQLTIRGQGVLPYINGVGQVYVGRSDSYSLGFNGGKSVTLQNGGELRLVGTGYNPDGATKNIVLGTGGGAINLAAAWQQYTFDDAAQLTGSGSLTKNGNGRLALATLDYNLTGDLILNAGTIDLNRVVAAPITTTFNGTAAAVSRFSSFSGVTNSVAATNAITVNGGILMPNSGTVSVIDAVTVTLNAGVLSVQGADHEYGVRGQVTGGPAFTTLVLNGGTILTRDAQTPTTARSPRFNSLLTGSGSVDIVAATNANGTPGSQGHAIFQRSDIAHTFNGTFVLRDYATIENRANQGTLAASLHVGKTIGNATLQMAGINTMLDMRDNGAGSSGTLSAYSTNNIIVSGTQAGSLYRLSVVQSTANTLNTFQFGNLTIGGQRFQVQTNTASNYAARVASMSLTGTPFLDLAANFQVDGAVNETGAGGQGIIKHLGNSTLTLTGAVNASIVEIRHGATILSGASGAINPGNISAVGAITINGATPTVTLTGAARANGAPLGAGVLTLDNTAATNANRLSDNVPVTLLSNSTLRLISQSGVNVNETTGNVSVPFGNPTFDVVRTGAGEVPVLTLGTLALSRGTNAGINFTGTGLGTVGTTARIILPTQATSTFLGAWATSGNEFAKYDGTTVDNGALLGVTALAGADYFTVASETDVLTSLNGKVTTAPLAAAPITLTTARSINSLNFQTTVAATAALSNVNTNGLVLTVESGGVLSSGQNISILGVGAGGITAGPTSGPATPAQLVFTNNGNTIFDNAIITNNATGGAVTLVKNGTGVLRLTNQGTLAGSGGHTNTFTGGVVVNAGVLTVTRGTYLGASSNLITLAGGDLEINQPSLTLNGVLSGFGHNILVAGNSSIGLDDNGDNVGGATELSDAASADNNLVPFGSLTINGAHTLGIGGFQWDVSFNGSSFSGVPTINLGVDKEANSHTVIQGAMTGTGFNVIAAGATPSTLIIGGGSGDAVSNAGLSSPITLFAATTRLNKANGVNAIGDGPAADDVVINGGVLAWGPGHVGDILGNNNNLQGLFNLSPAGARLAGQDQIADTATITVLSGTLGITDAIQNDVVGTLNLRNGTLNSGNSGEGKLEFGVGNISGGAVNFNFATHLKFGTLNLQSGAPNMNVTNGFITRQTVLEIGAGGLTTLGARIELQTGLNLNSGGGSVLRLGGNVTAIRDPLNFQSTISSGIFLGTGTNMREFSNSYIDLMGGTRDFNIGDGLIFGISALMKNGGFSKSGTGILDVQQYAPKVFDGGLFDGAVTVNGGVLIIRTKEALGTSLGGVVINAGGTLKTDGAIISGDSYTITGSGAMVSGTTDVSELGAIVVEQGQLTITGAVALGGSATLTASATALTGVAAAPITRAGLFLTDLGGITGTGTLTLSGNGDGSIAGGINTVAGGLNKDGAGRWVIGGNGTYVGATTVSAGVLRIGAGNALGSTAAGTTVYGGATLELAGGFVTGAEALTLHGSGYNGVGALRNVSGVNIYNGAVTLGSDVTLRSAGGTLALGSTVSGSNTNLTITGVGNGSIAGNVSLGTGLLTKTGTGTWTLSGVNTSGTTAINGGTLTIASAGAGLDPTALVQMGGGSLVVTGAAQNIAGLDLLGGGGTVNGGAGLNVGSITRFPTATVNFAGTVNAAFSSNTNGILGGYATRGSEWATLNGSNNVVAYTAYTSFGTATAADNAITSLYQLVTAPLTQNSLKVAGGSGVDLGANNVALSSGGILFTSSMAASIAGTGTLSGATSSDELIVTTTAGTQLDISAPIIGAGFGGLTKAGNGKLVLSGASSFSGPINVNGGTLSIVGPGGTNHPAALGANSFRTMTLNGGALEVVGGDYDPGTGNIQFAIGSAGGTFRSSLGAIISINDGPAQLTGSGNVTFTGGGRYFMSAGAPLFQNFTGSVTLDQGILTVGNVATLGGRTTQTLTLSPGTVFINNAGASGNLLGLPNDIVANSTSIFSLGGDRTFTGDIQFSGTNTIGLIERDVVSQNRSVTLAGRMTGSGTIDVFGHNQGAALGAQVNGNFLFLSSSSNTFAGTINLKPNAGLEGRIEGSLGSSPGAVTVNLDTNSRLLLRAPASGDYMANVVVNGDATISADRIAAGAPFGSGDRTQLAINNLTVNNGKFLGTLNGGNNYAIRVNGTATFTGNANLLLETNNLALVNGATFTGGSQVINKYGSFGMFLFDASNNTGATVIYNGSVFLRGTTGSLPNTARIELRGPGAALYIDNGDGLNANRVNDSADLVLGGGALRVNGTETLLANNVTAPGGHTTVSYTLASLTTSTPLTLGNTFTRSIGATVNFTTDNGVLGVSNVGQVRAQPVILIPGQAPVAAGDIIPWATATNNEFVRYDAVLGVTQINNIQSGNNTASATYINDPTFAQLLVGNIMRATANTTTLFTADATIKAIKMDGATPALNATSRRLDLNTRVLTVDRGVINQIGFIQNIGNSNTATTAVLKTGNATGELFLHSQGGTLEIGPGSYTAAVSTTTSGTATALGGSVILADNGATPLILVKSGPGIVELRNTANASTFTGGIYVNQGTLRTLRGANLGPSTNVITMNGGTLEIHSDESSATSDDNIANLGHSIVINGNAFLAGDNGISNAVANLDDNLNMGSLTINGGYILQIGGFDGVDWSFTSAALTGTPIFDIGVGRTSLGADLSTTTINGVVSGSGFRVIAGNVTALSIGTMQLAGATSNTYTGEVTVYDGTLQLNKTAGSDAITGNLTQNGGTITLLQSNQINDSGILTVNRGTFNLNGFADTVASVTQNGGLIVTGAGTLGVTGDATLRGTNGADGLQINSNGTVNVTGTLRVLDFGRAVLGASNAFLTVGGIEMTGTTIQQSSGAGLNIIRLNGNVVTNANATTANLGNSTDSDTYLELNGTRTFTVADGPAGIDLALSTVVRDSTAPVAVGGLIKAGAGSMQIQGGGPGNSYTGPTAVNDGAVVLFNNVGVNTLGDGSATNTLAIGDNVGAARSAQVIIRNSGQIADGTAVTLGSDGFLDLDTFNTSETIGALSGAAGSEIALGATSVLTAGASTDTTFSGAINGGGVLNKQGAGLLRLNGTLNVWTINANAGTLNINTDANNATVNANSTVNFGTSQTLTGLNIAAGVVVSFVSPPPFAGFGGEPSFGGGKAGAPSSSVVPEPGTIGLLMVGVLGLMSRRRRD